MTNPISVGTTAMIAIIKNKNRQKVRFQNTSPTQTLYFIRQKWDIPTIPSHTSYEFLLAPGTTADVNEAYIETNSIAQFNVVASASWWLLAIFETIKA